jgi:uncharacterized protein (TIGR02246 family)
MNYAALAGVTAALAVAIPASGAQTAAPPEQSEQVQQLANRWVEAYNKHDRKALGALYTNDARLYAHGEPTVAGRTAIENYWAQDMKESNPITVLTVTNAVTGLDMTLVHGNYQVLNRTTGVSVGHGRFAHIWVRGSDGAWRLDRDLWNQPDE